MQGRPQGSQGGRPLQRLRRRTPIEIAVASVPVQGMAVSSEVSGEVLIVWMANGGVKKAVAGGL